MCIAPFVFVTGCTTVNENLFGHEYENVLPFAEQTVKSIGGDKLDFQAREFAYLRVLYDQDASPISELSEQLQLADSFRSGIVRYSVELLRIAEMNMSEEEQVREYADTFETMRQSGHDRLQVSQEQFDTAIAGIRAQTTLLGALRTAQPVIDQAGENFDDFVRQIADVSLVAAVNYLDTAIEDHFEIFMNYNRIMVVRRDEILAGLTLLRDYRLGDSSALDRLRDANIILNKEIEIPASPTEAQLKTIEDYLLAETRRDRELVSYMADDVTAYLQAHAEVEREEAEILAGLSVARLQVVAWTRAHQAMAQGVKDPGNWLDLALQAAEKTKRILAF